jgi:8-oxo-dGTP pyrophosphatase MutT (NUDIX family)
MIKTVSLNRPISHVFKYSFVDFSNFVTKEIEHGFSKVNREKVKVKSIFDFDYSNDYSIQRPEQTIATKLGLSFDCVELFREYGSFNGYETKSFFLEYYDYNHHYHFYHSFIIIKLRDGLWYECPSNDGKLSKPNKGYQKERDLVANIFYVFKINVRKKIKTIARDSFYINEFNKPDEEVFKGKMDYIDWCHIEGIKEIKNKDEVSSMAIVISKNKSETKLLLLQTLHREWVYPKGHIEEGEDSIDCAIRECFEESGVKIERKNYIGKVNEYCYSFNSYDLEITNNMFYELFGAEKIYKTVEVHGFIVESTQPITWNEQERFIGGGWFSLEEAKKMITFDNSQIILQKTIEMLKAYEEK